MAESVCFTMIDSAVVQCMLGKWFWVDFDALSLNINANDEFFCGGDAKTQQLWFGDFCCVKPQFSGSPLLLEFNGNFTLQNKDKGTVFVSGGTDKVCPTWDIS